MAKYKLIVFRMRRRAATINYNDWYNNSISGMSSRCLRLGAALQAQHAVGEFATRYRLRNEADNVKRRWQRSRAPHRSISCRRDRMGARRG